MRRNAFAWSVLLGLAAGCSSGAGGAHGPQDAGADGPPMEVKDIPLTVNRDVDLLFVIDDSPSMTDKQQDLIAGFPQLVDVLTTVQGGLPNVHLGVVTTDLGTRGAGDPTPGPGIGTLGQGGCSGLGKAGNLQLFGAPVNGGSYLSDIRQADGTRLKNYPAGMDLATTFATMARAGAGGCGFEQPLEAMKLALQPTNAVNQGFLRASAYLAVVILTDEDDCSIAHASLLDASESGPLGALESFRCTRFGVTCDDGGATTDAMNQAGPKGRCHSNDQSAYLTRVADYASFLTGLKAAAGQVIVASLMGTVDPFAVELRAPPLSSSQLPSLAHSCSYLGGDGLTEVADPPVRLAAFLDQFPGRSTSASICQRDLSAGLAQVGALIRSVIGDPCIEGQLADVDPTTPGDQFACTVALRRDPGTPAQADTALPRCTPEDSTATNPPCWHLASDAVGCATTPTRLRLVVEGQAALDPSAHIFARCQLVPSR